MSFLAPFLFILAIVIPAKLSSEGVRMRTLALGSAGLGLVGLILFMQGFGDATPEAAAQGDPGRLGTVGILFVISALVAGITLFIIGLIRVMSGKSKG